jgi:hypothetical protein
MEDPGAKGQTTYFGRTPRTIKTCMKNVAVVVKSIATLFMTKLVVRHQLILKPAYTTMLFVR